MAQVYESFGISGNEFTNFGSFDSASEVAAYAQGLEDSGAYPDVAVLEEIDESGNTQYWVIADENELVEHEGMIEDDVEVEENPSAISKLSNMLKGTHVMEPDNGLKSYHAAREVGNAARIRDAYQRNAKIKSLLKNFHVIVSMQGDATRIYRPDTQQEIIIGGTTQQNPFPFKKCIRAAKRKGIGKPGAYCATVDRRMHGKSNPSHHKLSDIVYEKDYFYVVRVPKGFEVWHTHPGTHGSTRVASIGYTGQDGLDKVKQEVERRDMRSGRRVNPHKRNPEDAAEELYEDFHQRPFGELLEVRYEQHEHETLTGLGDLCQLKIITPFKKDCTINVVETKSPKDIPDPSQLPKSERIVLSSSEDGRQLYLIGGDQSVNVEALGFTEEDIKDSMLLGVLYEVTYQTEKGFDNFQLTNYYHKLGEESGVEPVLLYDPLSKLMSISGGRYVAAPEGLRD